MCGIFGFSINYSKLEIKQEFIPSLINSLFLLSSKRGLEATGLAIKFNDNKDISIYRKKTSAALFLKDPKVKKILKNLSSHRKDFSFLGHTRIATNGSLNNDNQPIIKGNGVIVHNGIICNVDDLWAVEDTLVREQVIDTELLVGLIENRIIENKGKDVFSVLNDVFSKIEGTASFGFFSQSFNGLLIGSNCGSLYYLSLGGIFLFASELSILNNILNLISLPIKEKPEVYQVAPTTFVYVDNGEIINSSTIKSSLDVQLFESKNRETISDFTSIKYIPPFSNIISDSELDNILEYDYKSAFNLKRCINCILPITHPYISFNSSGVCNYCVDYEKRKSRKISNGVVELNKIVSSFKSNGIGDCIVMLSGGRDSCYALHYVKKILGLNPIAFSYDWGMLTDLGRRNQARMCQKLGVEHIVVSADITLKRKNINLNVNAFLKKPHLGMIGLFMAGDKAYHYYAKQLSDQLQLPLINGGCPYEYTYFKEGFATIKPSFLRSGSILDKVKILEFFALEALKNPRFLNFSVFDNLNAFRHYYLTVLKSIKLFQYVDWDEKSVNDLLINEYNWEVASDTPTTWRIGDGTASFYNYIYFTVAGFTENDCFRSNLIKEGLISRDEALNLAISENKPRRDALRWYCDQIGINLRDAILIINQIPKLY